MKIFDERGITLYELLAYITVMVIITPVIYGFFTTGYKLYNKIQIEGQLRDDADYAVTMIMNEFYSFPFDYVYVESGHENSLTLVDNQFTSIHEQKTNRQTFYSINQDEAYLSEKVESVSIGLVESDEGNKILKIGDQQLESLADFSQSKIKYSCNNTDDSNNCVSGVIHLKLVLHHNRLEKPLELNSEFGF